MKMKMEKRISKFIKLLATQLHSQLSTQDEEEAFLSSSTAWESIVKSSIQNLPKSSLREALLQQDRLPQLLSLLREEIQAIRTQSQYEEQQPQKKILLLSKDNYVSAVKEAVDEFLKGFRDGDLDNSKFHLVFGQLLQAKNEPPLELLWSFAAVNFLKTSPSADWGSDGFRNQISVAKNLFQCLTACTVGHSCGASTAVASLVPVIAILSEAVREFSVNTGNNVLRKTEKIMLKNLKDTIGEIVSYIAVCRSKNENSLSLTCTEGCLSMALPCCIALLNSLNVPHSENGPKYSVERNMEDVFPFTSMVIQEALLKEDCSVQYLSSVVVLEASLLRLIIEVVDWRSQGKHRVEGVSASKDEELRQNLKILAVNGIAATKNQNFFDILLELLLEPNLPVASLLNGEEEVLLRGVLYEATTLVNYAFLKQSREYNTNETKPAGDKINLLFLNRLVVAHRAVQLFRSLGERSWAISFSKAFTNVHVPLELTRWLSSQKNQLKHTEALIQSRQALIGWLVNLEDQQRLKQILNKHPVFDRKKLPSEKVLNGGPNAEAVDISSNQKIEKGIEPDLFYVDMKGEGGAGKKDEELESVGKSFVVAAQNMKRIRNDGKRESNQKRKVHFQRHMLLQHEGSANKTLPEFGSDLSTSDESDLEFAGLSNKPKKSKIETESLVRA